MFRFQLKITTIYTLVIIIYFILAIGCENPFATREPEKPVTSQSTWIQPTSPDYVMVNLTNAIGEKNITNYIRCLADTSGSNKNFNFVAEPSVALKNPGLFSRWQKEEELNYLNQLMLYLPTDSTSKLSLKSLRENAFQDSVILIKEYTLKLGLKCEDNSCPRSFQGQVEFHLSKSNEDQWFIHSWVDFATGDEHTWSELRAYFGK
jgi:hypothetical protein